MLRKDRIALLALVLTAAAGCAPEAPAADGQAQPPEHSVVPEAEAPQAATLNDPQIAHVAVTANTIDVEAGRLAEARTTTPEVRAFARTMITDHSAVNEQAAALAGRLGVTPEKNRVSRSLLADAAAAQAELMALQGAVFDGAYIEREVAYHQAVLDALDQTLIPGARNAELRGLLEQVRPAIAAHLDHARSLQSSLSSDR